MVIINTTTVNNWAGPGSLGHQYQYRLPPIIINTVTGSVNWAHYCLSAWLTVWVSILSGSLPGLGSITVRAGLAQLPSSVRHWVRLGSSLPHRPLGHWVSLGCPITVTNSLGCSSMSFVNWAVTNNTNTNNITVQSITSITGSVCLGHYQLGWVNWVWASSGQ